MIAALVVGAGMGLGAGLIAGAIRRRPAPLGEVLGRLERPAARAVPAGSGRWGRLLSVVADSGSARRARHLAVLDRSPERHAVERLTTALALGALPLLAAVVMSLGGVHATGPAVAASVAAAPIGFWLPEFTLRSQAAARREAVVSSLSSYLDLVTVLLAGGTGTETALVAAAEAGDSWTFQRVRDALTVTRARRRSPWEGLAELGEEIGVDELVELASSVQLAGEQGAQLTATLAARASALRDAQLARVEARAQAATERMSLPTVLLFVGFLVLLGYPALQIVLDGFG